jgi:hypothetical protein
MLWEIYLQLWFLWHMWIILSSKIISMENAFKAKIYVSRLMKYFLKRFLFVF